ncbi:MAG: DNA-protecting protein DprA [Rhodobacteraceae bacterium]|nr:DNA-protecting protein DprA [Paracoccaceae bacterium]
MDGVKQANTLSLSEAQRLAWLRLIRSENIGPATFRSLLNHCGSAEAALQALPSLSSRGGKKNLRVAPQSDAEAELEAHESLGARLVALGEPDYPPHLRHIDSPPPLLSVRGGIAVRSPKTIAIAGARNSSLSGQKITQNIASELGLNGFVISSGLARGIDAAAHTASLQTGTVAVFAGGIDVIYPSENTQLLERILDNDGNAICEMPFGWKARGRDFPRRNRLISGMALGLVIIEAAQKSGSLHTARFALEQNREIFAVPGSPMDPRSTGANRLIQQGAMLTTCAADILSVLEGRLEPEFPFNAEIGEPSANDNLEVEEPSETARSKLLSALGPSPVMVDELIRFTGESPRTIQILLLELELAGRIERHHSQKVSLLY